MSPELPLAVSLDFLTLTSFWIGVFILAGIYAAYVMGASLFKPNWAPALPIEARTLREPDGSAGNRSLLVLTIISVIAAVGFAKWYNPPGSPLDEMIVVAASVGTGVALAATVALVLWRPWERSVLTDDATKLRVGVAPLAGGGARAGDRG